MGAFYEKTGVSQHRTEPGFRDKILGEEWWVERLEHGSDPRFVYWSWTVTLKNMEFVVFSLLNFKCFSSSLRHVMIIIVMMIVMMIVMVMMNHQSWMTNDEWWTIVINDEWQWHVTTCVISRSWTETISAKLQRLVIFLGWILRQNRSRLVRGQHSCSTAWLYTYQHQCSCAIEGDLLALWICTWGVRMISNLLIDCTVT